MLDQAPNDCEQAFALLAANPDAITTTAADGTPRLEIRRRMAAPGQLSDGTRAFIVAPCPRWRWLTVTLGWNTLAEIDQRGYFNAPARLAADVLAAIDAAQAEALS